MPNDVEALARGIYKSLEEDRWGDIDSYYFKYISEGLDESNPSEDDIDEQTLESVKSLRKALERGLEEVKNEQS